MKGVTSVAAEAVPTPWPGAARADLAVPEALWARALAGVDRAGGPLGFSAEVMANYGRDTHMLRPVALLFRDVRAIPRFSGKVVRRPARRGAGPRRGGPHRLRPDRRGGGADVRAAEGRRVGRRLDAGHRGAGRGPLARLRAHGASCTGQPAPVLEGESRRSWLALPEPLQRLVVRVLVGSVEAAPWLTAAFDVPFLVAATGGRSAGDLSPARLQKLAGRPWQDEDPDPKDAAAFKASFQALERVDRDALCLGSVVYLLHLGVALSEWRTARAGVDLGRLGFLGFSVETPYGALRLEGSGDDREKTAAGPGLLTVDPWGSDAYEGRQAVPASPAHPISTILDLAGDDRYDGGDVAGTLGCGLFGLGAVVDLAGDDTYRVAESGLGCAWYGTGLVYDEAGNDRVRGAREVGAGRRPRGGGRPRRPGRRRHVRVRPAVPGARLDDGGGRAARRGRERRVHRARRRQSREDLPRPERGHEPGVRLRPARRPRRREEPRGRVRRPRGRRGGRPVPRAGLGAGRGLLVGRRPPRGPRGQRRLREREVLDRGRGALRHRVLRRPRGRRRVRRRRPRR